MGVLAYVGPGITPLFFAVPFLLIGGGALAFVLAVIWIVKREQRRERA